MSTHPNMYRHPQLISRYDAQAVALRCIRARLGVVLWPCEPEGWEAGCAIGDKDKFLEFLKPEKDLIG